MDIKDIMNTDLPDDSTKERKENDTVDDKTLSENIEIIDKLEKYETEKMNKNNSNDVNEVNEINNITNLCSLNNNDSSCTNTNEIKQQQISVPISISDQNISKLNLPEKSSENPVNGNENDFNEKYLSKINETEKKDKDFQNNESENFEKKVSINVKAKAPLSQKVNNRDTSSGPLYIEVKGLLEVLNVQDFAKNIGIKNPNLSGKYENPLTSKRSYSVPAKAASKNIPKDNNKQGYKNGSLHKISGLSKLTNTQKKPPSLLKNSLKQPYIVKKPIDNKNPITGKPLDTNKEKSAFRILPKKNPAPDESKINPRTIIKSNIVPSKVISDGEKENSVPSKTEKVFTKISPKIMPLLNKENNIKHKAPLKATAKKTLEDIKNALEKKNKVNNSEKLRDVVNGHNEEKKSSLLPRKIAIKPKFTMKISSLKKEPFKKTKDPIDTKKMIVKKPISKLVNQLKPKEKEKRKKIQDKGTPDKNEKLLKDLTEKDNLKNKDNIGINKPIIEKEKEVDIKGDDIDEGKNKMNSGDEDKTVIKKEELKALDDKKDPETEKEDISLDEKKEPQTEKDEKKLYDIKEPETEKEDKTLDGKKEPEMEIDAKKLDDIKEPETEKEDKTLDGKKELEMEIHEKKLDDIKEPETEKEDKTLDGNKEPEMEIDEKKLDDKKEPETKTEDKTLDGNKEPETEIDEKKLGNIKEPETEEKKKLNDKIESKEGKGEKKLDDKKELQTEKELAKNLKEMEKKKIDIKKSVDLKLNKRVPKKSDNIILKKQDIKPSTGLKQKATIKNNTTALKSKTEVDGNSKEKKSFKNENTSDLTKSSINRFLPQRKIVPMKKSTDLKKVSLTKNAMKEEDKKKLGKMVNESFNPNEIKKDLQDDSHNNKNLSKKILTLSKSNVSILKKKILGKSKTENINVIKLNKNKTVVSSKSGISENVSKDKIKKKDELNEDGSSEKKALFKNRKTLSSKLSKLNGKSNISMKKFSSFGDIKNKKTVLVKNGISSKGYSEKDKVNDTLKEIKPIKKLKSKITKKTNMSDILNKEDKLTKKITKKIKAIPSQIKVDKKMKKLKIENLPKGTSNIFKMKDKKIPKKSKALNGNELTTVERDNELSEHVSGKIKTSKDKGKNNYLNPAIGIHKPKNTNDKLNIYTSNSSIKHTPHSAALSSSSKLKKNKKKIDNLNIDDALKEKLININTSKNILDPNARDIHFKYIPKLEVPQLSTLNTDNKKGEEKRRNQSVGNYGLSSLHEKQSFNFNSNKSTASLRDRSLQMKFNRSKELTTEGVPYVHINNLCNQNAVFQKTDEERQNYNWVFSKCCTPNKNKHFYERKEPVVQNFSSLFNVSNNYIPYIHTSEVLESPNNTVKMSNIYESDFFTSNIRNKVLLNSNFNASGYMNNASLNNYTLRLKKISTGSRKTTYCNCI